MNIRRHTLNILSIVLFSGFFAFAANGQEVGLANYYPDKQHRSKTASGEKYNLYKRTAAHKTLPFGTKITIVNPSNGRSCQVIVNDRLMSFAEEIVQISKQTMIDLAIKTKQPIKVQVYSDQLITPTPLTEQAPIVTTHKTTPHKIETEQPTVQYQVAQPPVSTMKNTPISRRIGKYGLFKINITAIGQAGFGLQLATYKSADNLFKAAQDLPTDWQDDVLMSIESGKTATLYKLMIGPYSSKEDCKRALTRAKGLGFKGFIIPLEGKTYP